MNEVEYKYMFIQLITLTLNVSLKNTYELNRLVQSRTQWFCVWALMSACCKNSHATAILFKFRKIQFAKFDPIS